MSPVSIYLAYKGTRVKEDGWRHKQRKLKTIHTDRMLTLAELEDAVYMALNLDREVYQLRLSFLFHVCLPYKPCECTTDTDVEIFIEERVLNPGYSSPLFVDVAPRVKPLHGSIPENRMQETKLDGLIRERSMDGTRYASDGESDRLSCSTPRNQVVDKPVVDVSKQHVHPNDAHVKLRTQIAIGLSYKGIWGKNADGLYVHENAKLKPIHIDTNSTLKDLKDAVYLALNMSRYTYQITLRFFARIWSQYESCDCVTDQHVKLFISEQNLKSIKHRSPLFVDAAPSVSVLYDEIKDSNWQLQGMLCGISLSRLASTDSSRLESRSESNTDEDDASVPCNEHSKTLDRPRKKQNLSNGKVRSIYRCRICEGDGHNKRTCPYA